MPKFFDRSLLKTTILAAELLLILPNISTELKGDEELIYHAEFEVDQGYDPIYILGGQGTWMLDCKYSSISGTVGRTEGVMPFGVISRS